MALGQLKPKPARGGFLKMENRVYHETDIEQKTFFLACGRMFNSQWAALRHLAKVELMHELYMTCDPQYRGLLGQHFDAHGAMRAQYPNYNPQAPTQSDWYKAVNKRAREIRARTKEKDKDADK